MTNARDLDQEIIAVLSHNARRGISDIALELKLSRATVRARIEQLEARGDIIGYTVVLRADTARSPVRGLMMVEIEGRMLDQVIHALTGHKGVRAIHTTNGRWDIVVELTAQSLSDLDALLRSLRLVRGITNSETMLLLATPHSTIIGNN